MKSLKIAAFVSIVVLVIAFVVYDFNRIFFNIPNLNYVSYQYVMLAYYIAIPINLVYLFKRLK